VLSQWITALAMERQYCDGCLTAVGACFDVSRVVGVCALFLGSGTLAIGTWAGPPMWTLLYHIINIATSHLLVQARCLHGLYQHQASANTLNKLPLVVFKKQVNFIATSNHAIPGGYRRKGIIISTWIALHEFTNHLFYVHPSYLSRPAI
jgi:hypothetical protein